MMRRIKICLLIAVMCAPVGCAEMNPWKDDSVPQPKTPPGSLNPVSTELPPPTYQNNFQQYQPIQQGLPGGVEPAGMPGQQFGAAKPNMIHPDGINAANLGQSMNALQADLSRDQGGAAGFAAVR